MLDRLVVCKMGLRAHLAEQQRKNNFFSVTEKILAEKIKIYNHLAEKQRNNGKIIFFSVNGKNGILNGKFLNEKIK